MFISNPVLKRSFESCFSFTTNVKSLNILELSYPVCIYHTVINLRMTLLNAGVTLLDSPAKRKTVLVTGKISIFHKRNIVFVTEKNSIFHHSSSHLTWNTMKFFTSLDVFFPPYRPVFIWENFKMPDLCIIS